MKTFFSFRDPSSAASPPLQRPLLAQTCRERLRSGLEQDFLSAARIRFRLTYRTVIIAKLCHLEAEEEADSGSTLVARDTIGHLFHCPNCGLPRPDFTDARNGCPLGQAHIVPARGTKPDPSHYCGMQWIEALINISALVGFVGVASLGGNTSDCRRPTEPMA